MQTISHPIQEIVRRLTFNKMLKLSPSSRSICQHVLKEWHTVPVRVRNVDKVTSRNNDRAIKGTVYAACVRHLHYKNPMITGHLVKRETKHSARYMVTDVSTDAYKESSESETNSGSDIESLVDKMLDKALERDKMVALVPKSTLSRHVKTLLNTGFREADIVNLSKYPQVVKHLAQVVDVVDVLLEYGLQNEDVTHILNVFPDIVHKTKADVQSTVQMLQEQGLTIDAVTAMICKQPDLLDKDLSGAPRRIEELKLLFKTKDTFRLLERSPNLLYCGMDYITERFNYVFLEMGITQPQMRYSDLFSFSMEHIHARHMFLVRAGFFKKVKKKEGQIDLNPKLDKIMDTSDAEFAKMFGNMTVTDYETFKKLLVRDRVFLKNVDDYTED